MACYYCEGCGNLFDGDWNPCMEHPTRELELVCEGCYEDLVYEAEQEAEEAIKDAH